MALTKRFFIRLASEYRASRPAHDDVSANATWEKMVRVTAAALKENNGAFNHERFYEACGITAE